MRRIIIGLGPSTGGLKSHLMYCFMVYEYWLISRRYVYNVTLNILLDEPLLLLDKMQLCCSSS